MGKKRAQNCLTISNLKLDDVFYLFGKSARAITEYTLAHLGEYFDVNPLLLMGGANTPIEESRVSIDRAILKEQETKTT